MTTKNPLSISKPTKVFKSIRVLVNLHENGRGSMEIKTRQVMGNLNYVRTLYEGYEHLKGDVMDEKILEYAKAYYIKADFLINAPIISENQLKNYIDKTRGNFVRELKVVFTPSVTSEEFSTIVSLELNQYSIDLKLRLDTMEGSDFAGEKSSDFDYFDIDIDYRILPNIISTIDCI